MKEIAIFTDTGSDMIAELKDMGVGIVPVYITFDGTTYLKQIEEIGLEEFYTKMREPRTFVPKTSLASIQDYIDHFEPMIKENKDIIYMCMNAKFSSTYQSAINAQKMLLEDYPEARIEIIDTTTVTYGLYALTKKAKELADANKTIDEIVDIINDCKKEVRFFFTVETLNYLKDGGRIGQASALVGELLNVKPVIKMENAELIPVTKVRGRKKSLYTVIDCIKELVGDNKNDYEYAILQADVAEEAADYAKIFEEEMGVKITEECLLGLSIGLHAGPGTLGISVIKK